MKASNSSWFAFVIRGKSAFLLSVPDSMKFLAARYLNEKFWLARFDPFFNRLTWMVTDGFPARRPTCPNWGKFICCLWLTCPGWFGMKGLLKLAPLPPPGPNFSWGICLYKLCGCACLSWLNCCKQRKHLSNIVFYKIPKWHAHRKSYCKKNNQWFVLRGANTQKHDFESFNSESVFCHFKNFGI